MSNNKDFKIKNGIKPTSYFEGVGTVTSASEGYYFSGASYDSVSFSVSSEETNPGALFFKSDGTKMYSSGNSGDDVNEYALSTAWDLSTASYTTSFDVSGETLNPEGLFFKPDGTKMYTFGISASKVAEYDLSTAWDISTASLNDTATFTGQVAVNTGQDLTFNGDGTKLYIGGAGGTSSDIYQYSLSTAYDITTASYDSVTLNTTTYAQSVSDLTFNSDGTRLYFVSFHTDVMTEWALTTPYDLSTASYNNVSVDISAQITGPQGLYIKPDGTKMYILDAATDTVYQYSTALNTASLDLSTGSVFEVTPTSDIEVTLSNPADSGTASGATLLLSGDVTLATKWDISTAVFSQNFSISSEEGVPMSFFFKPDGTKMYVIGRLGDDVNEYDLSTAWDISSASYLQNFSVSSQETDPTGISFKPDGTKMYVTGYNGDDVNEYDLSTAWDISTASYLQNFSIATEETAVLDLFFKPDGTKMYTVGNTDFVHEYDLSTAWDVSSAVYLQELDVDDEDTSPEGIFFKPDGTKMYICGGVGDDVNEYNLSTAWDVSTATLLQLFSVASEDTNPRGVFFKPDGAKMYILGGIGADVNEYDLGSAVTITYDTSINWSGGTAPTSPPIGETDVLTFNTTDGGTSYQGVLAIDGAK